MPGVEIMTATDEPKKYVEPHERKNGPWDDYELDEAGRHIERAEQIKGNPKFMDHIAKHHEKKAKRHRAMAGQMRHHMNAGHVSEAAMEKAAAKRG